MLAAVGLIGLIIVARILVPWVVTALNTALGANGTASFSDGVLQLSARGGNGLVISDDASNPTSRGGVPDCRP